MELLEIAESEMLHLKRTKVIACEVFDSVHGLNTSFMNEMFPEKTVYYFRDTHKLEMKIFRNMQDVLLFIMVLTSGNYCQQV